jgi:membrane-bound lytic murein transglycosylase D
LAVIRIWTAMSIRPRPRCLPGKTGAASLPEAQRSVTLLHGQKLSELIAMNGPVKAALEMWLTQWRPQLMDAYVNYQYMRFEMWPQYEKR